MSHRTRGRLLRDRAPRRSRRGARAAEEARRRCRPSVRLPAPQPGSAPVSRCNTVGLAASPITSPGGSDSVELGDGEVLVDDAAAIERHQPDDLVDLERQRDDDGTHPRRHLTGKPHEHCRIAIGDLVVDRRPPVARPFDRCCPSSRCAERTPRPRARQRRCRRSGRGSRQTRRRADRGEPLPERRRRAHRVMSVLDEAPVLVDRLRATPFAAHRPRGRRCSTPSSPSAARASCTSAVATPARRATRLTT